MRIFFIVLSLLLASNTYAYSPPIGIPDPLTVFGGTQNPIDDAVPARPVDWASEVTGYYYINAGTGSDTNIYGTPTAPRITIPNPAPPGSYIEIHGDYSVAVAATISIVGAGDTGLWVAGVSGPVWVTRQIGDSVSKINASSSKLLITGTYVYIDNMLVDGSGGSSHAILQIGSASVGYAANNIVVKNSEVIGNITQKNNSGISVVGDATAVISNIVIYNNSIHDTGDVNSVTDDDAHITAVGNYSNHIWFLKNTMYNGSGSGAQVGGAVDGADNCSFIYFGKNINYNSRQGGLWVKYANNVIFSQNTIYNIVDTSWSFSKGMGGQYTNDNIWYLYNTIYSGTTNKMSQGIYIASGGVGDRRLFIIGNKIYNIESGGSYWITPSWTNTFSPSGIFINGGTAVTVANNTIWGSNAYGITNTIANTIIENNIIGGRTQTAAADLWSETVTGVSVDFNTIYSASDWDVIWGASTHYTTLLSFQTGAPQCANCLDTDPNLTPGAYRIQSPSDSIDAGNTTLITAYTTFETLYSLSIKKDHDDTVRPAIASDWDIGADEFVFGVDIEAPVVSITTIPTDIGVDVFSISWAASDNVGVAGCKWNIGTVPDDNNGVVGNTSPASTSGYAQYSNTLYLGCFDAALNWSTDSITVNYDPHNLSVVGKYSPNGRQLIYAIDGLGVVK